MSAPSLDLIGPFAGWLVAAAAQATAVVCMLLLLERVPGLRPLRVVLVTLAMWKLATPPWVAWPVTVAGETFGRAALPSPPVGLATLVVLVWALGSFAALLRLVAMRIRLGRALERAAICEDEVAHAKLARVSKRVGLAAVPRLLLCNEAVVPYAAGVLSPVIVLPATWSRVLSADDLENVLLHEAAHVRRRDPLRLELAAALGVLWWWNPAFHWANRRWRAAIEDACDDLVLDRRAAPAEYCGSLLRAARLVTRAPSGVESLAGAAGMATGAMERRLRRLMGSRPPRSRRRAAVVFVAGTLLAAAVIPYVAPFAAPGSLRHAVRHAWKHGAGHAPAHSHSHP